MKSRSLDLCSKCGRDSDNMKYREQNELNENGNNKTNLTKMEITANSQVAERKAYSLYFTNKDLFTGDMYKIVIIRCTHDVCGIAWRWQARYTRYSSRMPRHKPCRRESVVGRQMVCCDWPALWFEIVAVCADFESTASELRTCVYVIRKRAGNTRGLGMEKS